MFVLSVRSSRGRLLAGLLCIVVFLAFTAAVIWWPTTSDVVEAVAAATTQDQLAYLRSLGCQSTGDPISVEEILIPDEADEAFTAYNELQLAAGFDLADYHGKRVKCWTYEVVGNEKEWVAHLYVYNNRLIGGDLTDADTGEQQPLINQEHLQE